MYSSFNQIVEVVDVVRSVEEAKQRIFVDAPFFGKNDVWQYFEISDQRLCPVCRDNGAIGTFRGTHLRLQFPELEILDVNTIKVNEHPRCRCVLVRIHRIRLNKGD